MSSTSRKAIPKQPQSDGEEQLTELVCPDCAGTLNVSRMGGHILVLRCRVGHLFAMPELLAAKERKLEQDLWSVVAGLEELAALLRDIGCDPERMQHAEQQAAAIRRIIETGEAVKLLASGSPDMDPGGGAP